MLAMDRAKQNNENKEEDHAKDCRNRLCKLYKTAIDSSADELVCPLTLELPMDPVMAEDGKVYERTAIEEHIEKNTFHLKSPVTNEPMGGRLLPALQVRNVIEQLVGSGAIDGDKAARWNDEMDKRKKAAALRKKAESGDADAMCDLAHCYYNGDGVEEDMSTAYSWYKRAADGGLMKGTAFAGWHLIKGVGVDESIALGMVFLGRAEEAGLDLPAFWLGKWLCKGSDGLPWDPAQGKTLLSKIVDGTCIFKHLKGCDIEEASDLLKKLDERR